jgi:hypothetical protein
MTTVEDGHIERAAVWEDFFDDAWTKHKVGYCQNLI